MLRWPFCIDHPAETPSADGLHPGARITRGATCSIVAGASGIATQSCSRSGTSINPCPYFTETRGAFWSTRGIGVTPSHQRLAGFWPFPHNSGETVFDYGSIGGGFDSVRAHQELPVRSTFPLECGRARCGFCPYFAHASHSRGPFLR